MTFTYESNDQLKSELKHFFRENHIRQKDISEKLGILPQKITNTLGKKSFRFEDIDKMLSAVGYSLVLSFEPVSKPAIEPEPESEPERIMTAEDAVKKLCEIYGVPYKPRKWPWEERNQRQ